MRERCLSIILVITMILSLSGCGGNAKDGSAKFPEYLETQESSENKEEIKENDTSETNTDAGR